MADTIQLANERLAKQINHEARLDSASPYAGKLVGIADGRVVVVAEDWDKVVEELDRVQPDPERCFCVDTTVDDDLVVEIGWPGREELTHATFEPTMACMANELQTLPIVKRPGVCGGRAIIRGERMPVWLLVALRRDGADDDNILQGYPFLTHNDLAAAWAYAEANAEEIDFDIRQNEEDDPRMDEPGSGFERFPPL